MSTPGKKKNTCKLMSFDTSTTSSGWGLFTNAKLTSHGIIPHAEKGMELEDKASLMIDDLLTLLNKEKPLIVVIEKPPYKNDPKTLIVLSEIVGAVHAWAVLNKADYIEYVPSQWRSLVAGEGEAIPTKRDQAKIWDIKKVKELFGIDLDSDDEADGILIGYARVVQFARWLKEGIVYKEELEDGKEGKNYGMVVKKRTYKTGCKSNVG